MFIFAVQNSSNFYLVYDQTFMAITWYLMKCITFNPAAQQFGGHERGVQ